MQEYQIWVEGYSVTGNSSGAQMIGTAQGNSFLEALSTVEDKHGIKYLEDGTPNIWGCRLYDNHEQAARSFG